MKNIKKTLFTSLLGLSLIMLSTNSKAIGDMDYYVDENSQKVQMKVNNPSQNEIDVYLFNAYERILFSDKAKLNETFESQVDFSNLKNGKYTLVSESGNLRLHKEIKVKNSKIELTDKYFSFTPVFRQEGDMLKVYFNNSNDREFDITIEDSFNTYHEASYSGNEYGIFHRDFSLQNLSSGEYTLTLNSNGEVFNHVIEID